MKLFEYKLDETVAILTMNSGENTFNPTFLNAFLDVLNRVENETDACTLVVTSSHEKIFSNGLDLQWLVPVVRNNDIDTAKDFFYLLNRVFKRILLFPMVTVAAISGHVFAGGAILSCCFDFRFMRSDSGYFCLPEVDLKIPLLPGMLALLKRAIPGYKFDEIQFTGSRLIATECQEHHIITKACHISTLMDETLDFAKKLGKDRTIVGEMKKRMHTDILHALDVKDVEYIESGYFHIE